MLAVAIDDSLVIRKILETSLRRAGFTIRCFPDGMEALRWLSAPKAPIPALVLVDLGLPKLDGYAVIGLLKVRPGFEQTVFVIVSQRDGVIDRLKGRLVGARAYLTKPFKTQDLLAVVQAHVCPPGEHRTSNAYLHRTEPIQRLSEEREHAFGSM